MRFRSLALASMLAAALPLPAHPRAFPRVGAGLPRPVVGVRPAVPSLARSVVVVGHRHHLRWCRRHHRHHRWHHGCR